MIRPSLAGPMLARRPSDRRIGLAVSKPGCPHGDDVLGPGLRARVAVSVVALGLGDHDIQVEQDLVHLGRNGGVISSSGYCPNCWSERPPDRGRGIHQFRRMGEAVSQMVPRAEDGRFGIRQQPPGARIAGAVAEKDPVSQGTVINIRVVTVVDQTADSPESPGD